MINKRKFYLLENALDSLEMGIHFFLSEGYANAHKHAILNIFHCIELLLKERLRRESAIFLYHEASERLITEKSKTIGFNDIFSRFKKLNIFLEKDDRKNLDDLQLKRNIIVHFEFIPSESDADIIGLALKFIKKFMEEHLDTKLKNEINSGLYLQIEELVDAFEERYERAVELAKELTTPITKDDLSDPMGAIECPDCGTDTLVCRSGIDSFCTLCDEEFEVKQCGQCGSFATSFRDDMCYDCHDYLDSKIEND